MRDVYVVGCLGNAALQADCFNPCYWQAVCAAERSKRTLASGLSITRTPVYDPDWPDGRLNLKASAFNQLGQYTSSPGRRGYCYTHNSPFSSLAVVVTIASTHCAYPRRDGQAELAWVAGYVVR